LATLRGRLKAKKTEIHKITANDLEADPMKIGLNGSPTRVVKIFTPAQQTAGEIVEGSSEELAERIFQKLVECKVI
jgi:electron transfer flavoprotein beta subunit